MTCFKATCVIKWELTHCMKQGCDATSLMHMSHKTSWWVLGETSLIEAALAHCVQCSSVSFLLTNVSRDVCAVYYKRFSSFVQYRNLNENRNRNKQNKVWRLLAETFVNVNCYPVRVGQICTWFMQP